MTIKHNNIISSAHALVAKGKYESVIEDLKPLFKLKGVNRDNKLEALALCANSCCRLSWYAEEVEFRKKRLQMIRSSGITEARERAALSKALVNLGMLEEAEEVINKIEKSWGKLEWAEHLQLKALIILRRDRDYQKAADLLQAASEYIEKSGPAFDQGKVKVLIGNALIFAQHLPKAEETLKEAQVILSKIMDRNPAALREYANSEFYLGDIERLSGNLDRALLLYKRSRKLLGDRASLLFINRYYQRLGTIYFLVGDYTKANKHYLHKNRLSAIERVGNIEDYFWCYLAAAKTLCAQNKLPKAKEMLNEAEKCTAKRPSLFIRGHLNYAEAEISIKSGDDDNAKMLYLEARKLFEQIGKEGYISGISDCLVGLGHIELNSGNVKEAVEIARECTELAVSTGFLSIQTKELLIKSEILAEGNVNMDEVFKDVLSRVDVISSPSIMFKVLANIYYYAHKFCDYELDVDIENRLKALKKVLSKSEHKTLYHNYVEKKYSKLITNHLALGDK